MIKTVFAMIFFILFYRTLQLTNQFVVATLVPFNITVNFPDGNKSTVGDPQSKTCQVTRNGNCYDFENKLVYIPVSILLTIKL